ncbi:MAG TPA: SUMF1/EgtB/PvdO family nonheme iron enzyme [Solirubrobacteraceae bacterium]|jgi:iron(II)-dependent oxidoreductase|nr:SUMF1/EgtB/PvdO family nonheme iron enzyme [Solirubrobacteraceae bacterium]
MARTVPQPTAARPPAPPAETLAALDEARRCTLNLVVHLDDRELERAHSPIMSPLVWDLAHIAAYEDLWLAHRHAGLELLRPDLAELYDAFETPRSRRGEAQLLDAPEARAYMEAVRERVVSALVEVGAGDRAPAKVGVDDHTLAEIGAGDGILTELVVRHELQHSETMRQTLALAGLLPPGEPSLRALTGEKGWLSFPAGAFTMGAGAEGFAYDNERPRHLARTGAFAIARRPVTNASWLRFSEGGGYERREWWSDEGWSWKEEYDITHHPSVGAGHAQAPVCHVSWFEADAFARAHDARLPTEAEWERAAASEQPGLEGVGQVWEWTASHFGGYPGFTAHPYREYSEVFFGEDYRVLRGGSWATHPRVASLTFRNWDYPLRRQIFAGVRLARDV